MLNVMRRLQVVAFVFGRVIAPMKYKHRLFIIFKTPHEQFPVLILIMR